MSAGAHPILVFDSGVGGLTVLAEIHKLLPKADTIFVADTAAFPYGALASEALSARVAGVVGAMIERFSPALVVIACHTASTLVLPNLRASHALPFVGTVPAIKPAAAMTKTGLISVLATLATVKRDYAADLIRSFAAGCDVTLVGSARLAAFAEAHLRGDGVDETRIAEEIAPCFVEKESKRTDVVVLACTHFPLLTPVFERIAPWAVTWLDPAPAIARRVKEILPAGAQMGAASRQAVLTSDGAQKAALEPALGRFGMENTLVVPVP